MNRWLLAAGCAAAAVLTGCAQPALQSAMPVMANARPGTPIRAWMSPEAKAKDLLYVSDDRGVVYVLTYPAGKLVGTLSGFGGPAGLCSDSKGNVFVTNTSGENVYEYAHAGKTPIASLFDLSSYPEGCAVDPASGRIAVTAFATSPSQGPGNVAIYPSPSKAPTTYTDKDFNVYLFCTFDASGNLFVDGLNNGTTSTQYAELPKGGSALTSLKVSQPIAYPGAIQWDGTYVAVEDVAKATLYRLKFSGSNGSVAGSLHLNNVRSHLLVQFWIEGKTLVVPFGGKSRFVKTVGLWGYPAGGAPTAAFGIPGDIELVGATVSLAR